MTTMNISLPDEMKRFVDEQVSGGGYSSASEYVRELVRAEQKRQATERLELELLVALRTPQEAVTPEYWDELRREALRRVKARKAAVR
ncbi:MAG: type II toxin-antitoxin system ParD family antitoxin [Gemmatimonadaceae bacterium]